jgi:ferric-dicitrate binding protein FerR (iron transport regulator)
VNNQRFNYLIEKYRKGSLSKAEYKELIWMLGEPGIEMDLEQQLVGYWKESKAYEEVKALQPPVTGIRRSRKRTRYVSMAASLVLLLGLFYYLWSAGDGWRQQEKIYRTGFGERLDINLNDGSMVTLNANSTLHWTEGWNKSKGRNVALEGEAFFKVKKQNGIPFTVHTNDVAVEVLGTSFNVDSRETKTKVYLDEGRVNLKLNDTENDPNEEKHSQEIIMNPGEQVSYSARQKKIEKSEGQTMITAAAWKVNVLNFKNMQFGEVLDLLRDIYGQSFECTDRKLLSTPMYLGVPYSNWEAVRQALELSLNIQFRETAAQHYVVKSAKN